MGTLLVILLLVTSCLADGGEKHTDSRCLCICPDVSAVKKGDDKAFEKVLSQDLRQIDMGFNEFERADKGRSIYLNASVEPRQCNCQHVVLIHLKLTEHEQDAFCPRCRCKFQTRNMTGQKVGVIIATCGVSMLVIYMVVLQCLEPILNRRGTSSAAANQENYLLDNVVGTNEGLGEGSGGVALLPVRGDRTVDDIINRLGDRETKWRKQVQYQRRNIYDTHKMLN